MKVKKILTFKSGNFAFSHNYNQTKIQPLEIEFRLLCESLKELPILPAQAYDFEQELTRKSIFSTAAIEGNPLNEDEVADIINNSEGEEHIEVKKIEIKNLHKAYEEITTITPETQFNLTENFIKGIHQVVANKLNYESCVPGYYRNHIVKVGDKKHGGVATPPKCLQDIKNLMAEYINWVNSDSINKLPAIIKSSLAHYHLALIHPFADGNGRTARLIEASLLRASGIKYLPSMLSNYYYREIDDYFVSFSLCRKSKENDITPFIEFVLKGAIESLNEVKNRITSIIREYALKEFYISLHSSKTINKRQLELLNLLLDAPEKKTITINSIQTELPYRTLYATVSDRTARRDLNKLNELKLITATGNQFQLDRQILNAL